MSDRRHSQENTRTPKFSIEDILRPDFPKSSQGARQSVGFGDYGVLRSNSKQSNNFGHRKDLKPETDRKLKMPSLPAALPAWIFCTRYSDRPTSGENLAFSQDFPKVLISSNPIFTWQNCVTVQIETFFWDGRQALQRKIGRQPITRSLQFSSRFVSLLFLSLSALPKKAELEEGGDHLSLCKRF